MNFKVLKLKANKTKRLKLLLKIFFLLILSSSLLKSNASFADYSDYVSPLEGQSTITGSFAEFRKTHFHTGVDISTDNKIGYPMLAVEAGYLQRIKISPAGYGKAVYLKLYDGNIVVYAHLSKFSEKIEKLAEKEQLKNNSSYLDYYFMPDEIPLKKQETIGYSGDTGGTVPHLHLEFRNEKEKPFNIFLKNNIKDSLLFKKISNLSKHSDPLIEGLALMPLNPDSFINGQNKMLLVKPIKQDENHYYIREDLSLSGQIGIAVQAYDLVKANKIGTSQSKLLLNNEPIYGVSLNSLDYYTQYRKNFLIYDRSLFLAGKKRFLRLFKIPGNDLDFSNKYPLNAGLINTLKLKQNEKQRITILVKNSTNTKDSHLNFTFNIAQPIFIQDLSYQISNGNILKCNYQLSAVQKSKRVSFFKSPLEQIKWQPFHSVSPSNPPLSFEKEVTEPEFLLKAVAEDIYKVKHAPRIIPVILKEKEKYKIEKIPWEIKPAKDYLIIKISLKQPVIKLPQIFFSTLEKKALKEKRKLKVTQTQSKKFQAKIEQKLFSRETAIKLTIKVTDLTGNELTVTKELTITPIHPQKGGSLFSPDKKFSLKVQANDIFSTIYPRLNIMPDSILEKTLSKAQKEELKALSSLYRILPEEEILKRFQVSFLLPANHDLNLGIFTLDGQEWKFIGKKINGQKITAKATYFSQFALFQDSQGPKIYNIKPSHNSTIYDRLPLVSAEISDKGSGLKYKSVILRLNGKKLLAFYDLNKNSILYKVKNKLKKGKHFLSVEAEDKTGNKTEQHSIFSIK